MQSCSPVEIPLQKIGHQNKQIVSDGYIQMPTVKQKPKCGRVYTLGAPMGTGLAGPVLLHPEGDTTSTTSVVEKGIGLPVANVHGGQSWILIDHERQNASTPMILATAAFHCLARPVKPIRPCPVTNSRIRPPFQQRQCDVKLFFFKSSDQGSWTLW